MNILEILNTKAPITWPTQDFKLIDELEVVIVTAEKRAQP